MLKLLKQLRRDEAGVILTTELVIIGSVLVVGLITGVTCLQHAVDGELRDLGSAIGALDQSFSFSGHRKPPTNGLCCAWTAGSSYLNCEPGDCAVQQHDVLGTDGCCQPDCLPVHSDCHQCGGGGCNHCQSGGTGIIRQGRCGGCGSAWSGSGCGQCGSTSGMRILNSGVPNMKISEWTDPGAFAVPYVVPGELMPIPDGSLSVHGISSTTECCEDQPLYKSGDIRIPEHVW